MAAMTAELGTIEPKIKAAMESIGGDMLDEIELEMMLKESEEQFKRGETTTVEEMKKRTTERLNNGYYLSPLYRL